ncbi:MAG: Gfo/Idh/MocA family oxidoreductase [Cyclobacteriaceae bacterium]|nr:Gfo/Idh/MocA family oxidoreductase [Cyclobacteriaceae bacterium]
MKKLRFAIFGTGFWSQFQLGAWQELEGVECVALYNRTKEKADKLAARFGLTRTYDDPEALLSTEKIDFVDIITDVDTHLHFVELSVKHGVKHIICQKPMGPDFASCKKMMEVCRSAGAKLYIHENYRWERPLPRFKEILDSGAIGKPFKARVSFNSGYPVFDNQPFLAELDKFILTDMGSHVFDVTRFMFGECKRLWCQKRTVNPKIKGEDVASVMLQMENGMPVFTELSYSSIVEHDAFTTVFIFVEGDSGSMYMGPGFEIRTTTKAGTTSEVVTFPSYDWADPNYIVNHESGIPINQNILDDMLGLGKAETTGEDNFNTVKMVWAAYASAERGEIIELDKFE